MGTTPARTTGPIRAGAACLGRLVGATQPGPARGGAAALSLLVGGMLIGAPGCKDESTGMLLPPTPTSAAPPTAAPPPPVSTGAPPASVASAGVPPVAPPPTVPGASPAIPFAVQDLQKRALGSTRAYELVQSLTDEAGPRLAGSAGEKVGIEWAERVMKTSGLANVRIEIVKVPKWERGVEAATIVAPYPHKLVVTALGGSIATSPLGVEGELLEVESLEALDKLDPAVVKKKIVFVNVKTARAKDGSGYEAAVGTRFSAASRAGKLGAAAVLIRSIGTSKHRVAHTGFMLYEAGAPKIPAAALAHVDADLLHRLVARGMAVKLNLQLGPRTSPDVESANVVGEVLGSEVPHEVVFVGAHLDSWDLGTGASDDAAGCAIVLEAARLIAELPRKPRRTVRVVLLTNEENGLAGARQYALANDADMLRHVVAFEADAGAAKPYEIRFLGDPAGKPAFAEIARAVQNLGLAVSDAEANGGPDLIPLRAAGVPIVDVLQDVTDYFDVHHSADDTIEHVRGDELAQAVAAYASAVYAAADTRANYGRIPPEKRQRK